MSRELINSSQGGILIVQSGNLNIGTIAVQLWRYSAFLLIFLAGLLAIPTAVFSLEIIAAVFKKLDVREIIDKPPVRPRVAVLIPAHNEILGLRRTIADVRAQLRRDDTAPCCCR